MNEAANTEWCNQCHRRQEVVHDHLEEVPWSWSHSYTTRYTEHRVLDLACGHSQSYETGRVRSERDPGA